MYTVGTGSWRRIPSPSPLKYVDNNKGAFLNGNIHFLANTPKVYRISCLDLETEVFTVFSAPSHDPFKYRAICVLRGCLCVCDNAADELTSDEEVDIWLMKDYGDDKSWTKVFVISKEIMSDFLGIISPIKVFKNGDALMEWGGSKLLYYSSETRTIRHVDVSGLDRDIYTTTAIYAPSFLCLQTFAGENVSSF